MVSGFVRVPVNCSHILDNDVTILLCRKNEAGGWMNLALGRTPPAEPPSNAVPFGSGEDESKHATAGELLENRIQELADQLGIEPTDLASAIKTLVHPAEASTLYGSVSSEPTENSGNIVDVLTEDINAKAQEGMENPSPFAWIDTVVGLDEPPNEIPV